MKLHEQVKDQHGKMVLAVETINELFRYLNSNKFSCGNELDGYVNISDVIDRLRPALSELSTDKVMADINSLPLKKADFV